MPIKRDRGPRFVRARAVRLATDPNDPDRLVWQDDHGRAVLMLEILGRVLSLARRRLRLSQQEMAHRLRWPQSVVSKVENGEVHLTVEQLDAWVTVVAEVGEADDDGATADLTPGQAFDIADALAEALDEEAYEVRWGTGRLYDGERPLVRGAELEALLLRRWPSDYPRLR